MRITARRATCAVALLLGAGCQSPATQLEVTAHDEGQRLVVTGTTSLPDAAPILLGLQKTPLDPPIVEGIAIVRDHRFTATLKIPSTLPEGPCVLRVYFSPRVRTWTPTLKEAVGAHGEKLRGPLVHRDADGNNVLELFEQTWVGPPSV